MMSDNDFPDFPLPVDPPSDEPHALAGTEYDNKGLLDAADEEVGTLVTQFVRDPRTRQLQPIRVRRYTREDMEELDRRKQADRFREQQEALRAHGLE